jgi:hypothetical protein
VLAHPDRFEAEFLGQFGIGGQVLAAALKQKGSELHLRSSSMQPESSGAISAGDIFVMAL